MIIIFLLIGLAAIILILKSLTRLNATVGSIAKTIPTSGLSKSALAKTKDELRILIVGSDTKARDFLARYLGQNGFGITVSPNVSTIGSELSFDAIVFDAQLPGEAGFEQIATLRTKYAAPVLMLVASGETASRIVERENGPNAYLRKPFEPSALVAHLSSLNNSIEGTSSNVG